MCLKSKLASLICRSSCRMPKKTQQSSRLSYDGSCFRAKAKRKRGLNSQHQRCKNASEYHPARLDPTSTVLLIALAIITVLTLIIPCAKTFCSGCDAPFGGRVSSGARQSRHHQAVSPEATEAGHDGPGHAPEIVVCGGVATLMRIAATISPQFQPLWPPGPGHGRIVPAGAATRTPKGTIIAEIGALRDIPCYRASASPRPML